MVFLRTCFFGTVPKAKMVFPLALIEPVSRGLNANYDAADKGESRKMDY